MRRFVAVASLLAAVVIPVMSVAASDPTSTYIVVLRPAVTDVSATASALTEASGGTVGSTYEHAIDGFSLTASASTAAAIEQDPRVEYVEKNQTVQVDSQTTPTGVARVFADTNRRMRIDGVDDVRVDADVAVIDTGIDLTHPDLNVAGGVNCVAQNSCVTGGNDDHYHGTHVAGIIGAIDNGIGVVGDAPGVRLWAVKVLDSQGSGDTASVIRGIDWVTAHADTIEVANMSLGAPGYSQAMYDAIQSAVDKGVAFAVAAGNSHASASGESPAAFGNVLTVSALADFDGKAGGLASPTCRTDQDDTLADFSNWGAVDIAAPGVCIASTLPTSLTAYGGYGIVSGTSMAAPYVAGALALLARARRATTASEVQAMYATVVGAGNFNWTDDSGDGVKEPLLDLSNTQLFAAATAPCASVNPTGLLARWKGEQSLAGSTGPSLTGTPTYGTAEVGKGFSFDGSASLSIGGFPAVSTAVTVEAWVKPTTLPAWTIISRWDFPSLDDSARAFDLTLLGNSILVWSTDETSSMRPKELRAAAPQLLDGTFHHVAATWTTSSMVIYVDGAAVASSPSQGGTLNTAAGVPFRLGGGGPFVFSGVIDEPSVWSRALSASEIASIADAGPLGTC